MMIAHDRRPVRCLPAPQTKKRRESGDETSENPARLHGPPTNAHMGHGGRPWRRGGAPSLPRCIGRLQPARHGPPIEPLVQRCESVTGAAAEAQPDETTDVWVTRARTTAVASSRGPRAAEALLARGQVFRGRAHVSM
jgi:hypothetical protein